MLRGLDLWLSSSYMHYYPLPIFWLAASEEILRNFKKISLALSFYLRLLLLSRQRTHQNEDEWRERNLLRLTYAGYCVNLSCGKVIHGREDCTESKLEVISHTLLQHTIQYFLRSFHTFHLSLICWLLAAVSESASSYLEKPGNGWCKLTVFYEEFFVVC